MQCYIPNFKNLSKVILKKKIFEYFFRYFYGSNLGPLRRGHLGPCGLDLNKLGKRPLGNATNEMSIKVVKILQELAESEPKAIPNIKGKDGQTYLNEQQNYR